MRPLVAFLVLGAVLMMLAAIAIVAMISIGTERPSWLLIGVFVADSIALLIFAGYLTVRRHNGKGGGHAMCAGRSWISASARERPRRIASNPRSHGYSAAGDQGR